MNRVFIDANIIMSMLDNSRSQHESAKELMISLMRSEETIMVLSEDILTNIVYNSKGFKEEAVRFIDFINSSDKFLIGNFGKEVIALANEYFLSNKSGKKDYEDALQYFCAIKYKCNRIYTDDTSSFPKLKLPLYSSEGKLFYEPNA